MVKDYNSKDFGPKEEKLIKKYQLQLEDAKNYFKAIIKPRLDRAYKIYICDGSDRAKEIQKWQANVYVPYAHAVVETLKPRILDARPELGVQGRTEDDQRKAPKIKQSLDYNWEISKADDVTELLVGSSLVYGTGYMQAFWKKDVRELDFLDTKDLAKKKLKWTKRKQVFYDAPYVEWVDNYDLWYDWHNVDTKDKQYWFRRKVLNGATIKRRYPNCDKKRLEMALKKQSGDLTDYAQIRNEVKLTHEGTTKGDDFATMISGLSGQAYMQTEDQDLKMHEVFEWTRPFDDRYVVMVNDVPILKGGEMPIPYDYKEASFIAVPFLKLANEFEGYGVPMLLESPQILLNMIKNQRLDAMTLNIHKMWVVNPLANINKEELVTRPFGIIYSTDPNGVREIQFSDIKASAYKEEELLKGDMRYGIGVDDFSMGGGGSAGSATEVRHLRESTLERVRLFVNHLGSAFSDLERFWISMQRQFFTKAFIIRITGDNGKIEYPLIEKDDLKGEFDFKATVLPSIAGQNEIKKKQDMDLFQLLASFVDPQAPPFVDAKRLVSKLLYDWNWDIESISVPEQPQMPMLPEPGAGMETGTEMLPTNLGGGQIPADVAKKALAMLGDTGESEASPFAEASMPINLLKSGAPPTPKGVPTTNPRGMNRGGKVNTNISTSKPRGVEENLMNRASNIQR
jgi:hypothetical protein